MKNKSDARVEPEAFLENLILDPINFGDFKTEDGNAFVYSAIDSALDRLSPRVAERYVSRLQKVGYDVNWVAPAIIDIVD